MLRRWEMLMIKINIHQNTLNSQWTTSLSHVGFLILPSTIGININMLYSRCLKKVLIPRIVSLSEKSQVLYPRSGLWNVMHQKYLKIPTTISCVSTLMNCTKTYSIQISVVILQLIVK